MPRQGVTSSFQFGRSFGALESLAYLLSKRVDYVAPAVGKYLGIGPAKQDSLRYGKIKSLEIKSLGKRNLMMVLQKPHY